MIGSRPAPAGAPTTTAPRKVRAAAGALSAALAAGVLGFALAPLGSLALYAVGAVLGLLVVAYLTHDVLGPPLRDALDRVRPARHAANGSGLAAPRPSRPARVATGAVVTIGAGLLAWVVAQQGMKAIAGLAALGLGAVALWLLFPLVADLVRTPPEDVPVRTRTATSPGSTSRRPPSGAARVIGTTCTVFAAGVLAWVAAHLGLKGLLALIGVIGAVALLTYVRDRSVFFTFAAVCSLAFVLHKSFTTQDLQQSGGAISIYLTTFDAVLLLLYGIWILEGTFREDVRAATHRRILGIPLLGALFLVPSLFVAPSVLHSASELFRMGWMYLLFFYVAVRVRTRRHVWAVLAGLAVLALIECVVVVLQAKTGGVLGLSFLGVPRQLGERVTDTSVIGRPFGTIIHPVFMGAVMGALALVALAMALELRRSVTKLAAIALLGVCLLPLYLAHTRAALVAFGLIALVVVGIALAQGRLQWATIGRVTLVLLVGAVLFWPQLTDKFTENFSTGHFTEEVDSRAELNDIAGRMIDEHPAVGVGLNNFELVMGPYEKYGIIFFNNPVHNLYLLDLAETGIVGFAGVVLVGVAMYDVAIRLARSRDRLLGGVGLGVAAAMAFLMVEELLGFSLRQDIPLALYWLLAGLAVACSRLAGFEGNRAASARRRRGSAPPDEGAPGPRVPDDDLEQALRELLAARRVDAGRAAPAEAATAETTTVQAAHLAALERRVHDLATTLRSGGTECDESRVDVWLDELAAMPLASADDAGIVDGWLAELAAMALADAGEPTPVGPDPTRGRASASPRWGSRRRVRVGLAALALLAGAGVLAVVPGATPSAASSTAGLRITFTATDRSTGQEGIYVANGDGTGIRRITPPDGRFYNWPQWAYGGSKIVYTVRTGAEGQPEDLYLMNADGTGVQLVQRFEYRIAQPKVTPDGRGVVFTAQTPWFPEVALYRLDLETLEAVNLSAVTRPEGAIDADPLFSPSGTRLVLAASDLVHTQVHTMRPDGTDRRALTADEYFNTDPDLSPNERQVAIASYRGVGSPGVPGRLSLIGVKTDNWFLVTRDLATGAERVLTKGRSCVEQSPAAPCTPDEVSAFKPRWTPDGREIGFNGTLDFAHSCLCVIGADGTNPRALILSDSLALDWFDWAVPSPTPPPLPAIGSRARASQLLLTVAGADGVPQLVASSADLMHRVPLDLPAGLHPESARWTADHRTIVFTARVPVPSTRWAPHPVPPPGAVRRDHFTLDQLDPTSIVTAPPSADPYLTERQVFLREASGRVRQLTDPWIEDWRDGVAPGDARGNTDPVISPDGRYVVFTNTSSASSESFLLRLDLQTGEVLNLTNGTAGAQRVDDAHAQFSADGSRLAFTWSDGGAPTVHVMDSADGRNVTSVTTDDAPATSPTFTPDGRSLFYASYRGTGLPVVDDPAGGPPTIVATGWVLVRLDLVTGTSSVLTTLDESPAWQPVVAPEGDRVLFLGKGVRSMNVFVLPTGAPGPGEVGAGTASGRRPLQSDPHQNHLSVDWK